MNINAVNQVLILFLMMLVGTYANKKKIIDAKVEKGLSDLVMQVTLPCLIFSGFNLEFSEKLLNNGIKILIYSLIIHIGLLIFTKYIYFKVDQEKKPTLRFITIFTNCGFMGYPVLQSIFGNIGVFYAAMYNMIFTIFAWTIGVSLYAGKISFKQAIKEVMKNPSIWAVIGGIILFISRINIPEPIMKTIELVGGVTTPIAMMIIGSMLCRSKLREVLSEKSIYFASFIALIVTPLIVYVTMKTLNLDSELIKICTLIVAMPGAVIAPIIAAQYDSDYVYASQCIFLTTVLSIITVPSIIYFII